LASLEQFGAARAQSPQGHFSVVCKCMRMSGRKDTSEVDGTRSNCISQVHVGVGRMELRSCHVGGNFIWRTAVLELAKSGRDICSQQRVYSSTADGLSLFNLYHFCHFHVIRLSEFCK